MAGTTIRLRDDFGGVLPPTHRTGATGHWNLALGWLKARLLSMAGPV